MSEFETLKWENGKLVLLDQTLLPNESIYKTYDTVKGVWEAIQTMVVRGAPAIGVAAAYGMVIAANAAPDVTFEDFWAQYKKDADYLASSRPTAVNLFWAIERMTEKARELKALPLRLPFLNRYPISSPYRS